jgi:pimeloyl-ACP methyl ester carboxylesterase
MRLAVGCVLLSSLLAGCGGGGTESPTPAPAVTAPRAPSPVDFCGDAGPGWHELAVPGTEVPIDAVALGSGPAVVLLNQSDNDPCVWMPLARRLADARHTVAVFRYTDTAAASEKQALHDSLAVANAVADGGRYAMIGASLGGRLVFEAAARRPRGLAGIVSLSGETVVEDYADITPEIRRVTLPVLYAGTREDPLTAGSRQPRRIRAVLRARHPRFIMLPGAGHGIDLLDNAAVVNAIDRFVGERLG